MPDAPSAPTPEPRRRRRTNYVSYLRSGLYATKRPELPGPETVVGAVLAERRRDLLADLGGEAECSTAQRLLVDLAVRQSALVDAVDGFLLGLPSLVDRRHRRCWQVVLDRSRLAAQLEATLCRLGLERRAKKLDVRAEFAKLTAEARPSGNGARSAANADARRASEARDEAGDGEEARERPWPAPAASGRQRDGAS